jgi:branched-subunit amino acid aminotransferase/4-amino-4-deoxychorismate lyase
MLTGNKLITPVSEGCLNGVMKAGLGILKKMDHLEVVEEAIRPLIYKKADELFITNVKGIQPITKYRKKRI